ncbi:MAG TPA: hypothetical protein VL307_02455, partial [Chitinophagaceae bacterium]|nr:hypothetical protein [Chitinophagaceae bacterium]
IKAFRYGVKWINGYQFTIGRMYCIDIQASTGEEIHLRMKTVYGLRRQQLHKKFQELLSALHYHFFDAMAEKYFQQFITGQSFELAGATITSAGICINKTAGVVPWSDIGVAAHREYHSIFNKLVPGQYRTFDHVSDWNAPLLYSVVRGILKEKGIEYDK